MDISIVLHEVFADKVEPVLVNWGRCSLGRPKGIGGSTLVCDDREIEVMESPDDIDAMVTDKLTAIHSPPRPQPLWR